MDWIPSNPHQKPNKVLPQKESYFYSPRVLAKIIIQFCSIVAIDPAELEEGVADRPNVVHLKHKVDLNRRSGRQDTVLIAVIDVELEQ